MLVDSGPAAMAEKTLAVVRDLARRVTSSPMPAKSCVGVAQGCQWWSSSELLPTTTSPRAPRPIGFIINTSDDPDDVGGNAVIGAAGRTFGVRNIDNTSPGASDRRARERHPAPEPQSARTSWSPARATPAATRS